MHDGHVLLHHADYERFWSLPGGRAEILEESAETVVREMQEELGATVQVQRLLWIVENFFTLESKRIHELGLYYLVRLPGASPYLDTSRTYFGVEADVAPLIFTWFRLEDLEHVHLVPSFLQSSLRQLPESVVHLVQHDPHDIQHGAGVSE